MEKLAAVERKKGERGERFAGGSPRRCLRDDSKDQMPPARALPNRIVNIFANNGFKG